MYARDSPDSPGTISTANFGRDQHLVAIAARLQPACRSSSSDSPPLCPGAHIEYASAVSMKLKPAATNASSTSNDACSIRRPAEHVAAQGEGRDAQA